MLRMTAHDLQMRLRALGNPADAVFLAGFFKTGPGQYGEGDVLIGVRVPVIRKVAGEFKGLPLREVARLLHSAIHEERLAALVILVWKGSSTGIAGPCRAPCCGMPSSGCRRGSERGSWAVRDGGTRSGKKD